MARKRGLGQGLNALIDSNIEETISTSANNSQIEDKGIKTIKITEIEPNTAQPRKQFDEDALEELSESIKHYGVLQPLIVQKNGKFYEIIAGERRWRAAKKAGLKEIPVIVKDYSKEEILEVSLIENIQRENLNSIEEAIAYKRLISEFHLKQDEIAEKVSKSRSAIANTLRLLQLDERVQKMIVEEMLSSGHARNLISIKDKELQYELAMKIFDEKLSVRETEKLIRQIEKDRKDGKKKKNEKKITPEIEQIQLRIEETFGTKVKIQDKNNKGKIEIAYYSADEFERIVDLINSIK